MSGSGLERRGLQLTRQITKVIGDATYAEDGSIQVKWNSIMWSLVGPVAELCTILIRIYIRLTISAIVRRGRNMLKYLSRSISISAKNISKKE